MNAFLEKLGVDFNIPDPRTLIEPLHIAELAYEGQMHLGRGGDWAEREANHLDELTKLIPSLWKAVDLLGWLELPLAQQLSGVLDEDLGDRNAEVEAKADELHDLRNRLADVCRAVPEIPRKRRDRGQRKVHFGRGNKKVIDADYGALRAAMDVLVGYWTRDLGREFQQNQYAWEGDRPKPNAPAGLRFAFACVEHMAPGRGQALKTIARDYTRLRETVEPSIDLP